MRKGTGKGERGNEERRKGKGKGEGGRKGTAIGFVLGNHNCGLRNL
jgi:hypothetical protein